MIEVTSTKKGISIKGHAGYAEHGKDIVCAGVSVLWQGLIESVYKLTDDEPKVICTRENTYKLIYTKDKSEIMQTLILSFLIAIEGIAYTYPNNVKLTKH